jgi:hypothetical protein
MMSLLGRIMIKKILMGMVLIAFILVVLYAFLTFQNNKDAELVTKKTISESLEQSTIWLMNNREQALSENNAMLWWMIKRSAEVTKDYRLELIYKQYRKRYIDGKRSNVWKPLFIPFAYVPVNPAALQHFPDYNVYFIYGLTCNDQLGDLDIVKQQGKDDFCPDHHPISPACVTHQLMGLRFRQNRSCGDTEIMAKQVVKLQGAIAKQLTWDPRVVDVYLQRVLMLVDTGARERVKNRWLHNIIIQQSAEGGWGNFQSLMQLSDNLHLGFYSKGITFGRPRETLHATAQGILLMSLMSQSMSSNDD